MKNNRKKRSVLKWLFLRSRSHLSSFKNAKRYREGLIANKSLAWDILLITLGIFSASFGLKGFLLANRFIDGGATGISLLLTTLTGVPLHYLILLVNLPFVFMAFRTTGAQFAVKAALAIAGLALCLATVTFPHVTNDNILVAVFGGFFLGAGIGLAIRGGSVIDGTEILAIFLSRKLGSTIGDIIIVINVMIFAAVAYFLSVETAMFSMITYISASKTLDFVVEGIEEYIGVTIIARQSEKVRLMIIEKLGRGVTIYSGEKGYGKSREATETDVIYTVVTRLEINKLNTELQKIEPDAFVVMTPVKDTKGGMIKKRRFAH